MRQVLQNRNRIDIGCIARGRFKRADAALAQHHLLVAARQNIFSRHQQLLDGCGKSALEKHRRLRLADGSQKVEVLHVARPDLQNIHTPNHQLKLRLRHDLGHDGQSSLLARLGQIIEAFFAESLKRIRRCARFEDFRRVMRMRPLLSPPEPSR